MGWFDEQIRLRKISDQEVFDEAIVNAAGAVLGERMSNVMKDDRIVVKNVIEEILKYYHKKPIPLPEEIKDFDESLDFLLRPHGIMRRSVCLDSGWYREAFGPMIGILKEGGTPVALLPSGLNGYAYRDPETGQKHTMDKKEEGKLEKEALCFYFPFPQKKLNTVELFKYMALCFSPRDFVLMLVMMLVCTLIGRLLPILTHTMMGPVLRSKSVTILGALSVFLICVIISNKLFNRFHSFVAGRFDKKLDLQVEAAGMMRMLSLPSSFFRKYNSGEISSRLDALNQLCGTLLSTVTGSLLGSLFSLVYLEQILHFAPSLLLPSMVVILSTVGVTIGATLFQSRITEKEMEKSATSSGMTYALINGVQKVRLAGAEKRAFARWLNCYAESAAFRYSPPLFIKLYPVILDCIPLVGNIFFYYYAVKSMMRVEDYYAFVAAYGMVSSAFSALGDIVMVGATVKPVLKMAEPFLQTVPETQEGKTMVQSLSGQVELEHVSFSYEEGSPMVIDDLSLKIRKGEYVAIVGHTGCGKSTLFRLLLGFETPSKGAIYYDGKDLKTLDLKTVRRKIGTVIQNGGLFSGTIFSNIAICAPNLTEDEAWEAAEIAGLAEDISFMPMGMNTVLSEGQGGISGGQKQRLLIARAIAPKPSILMFDEATSALDNKTQKKVSDALETLHCTRIVIAHRLSTIRHCDRILVLDGGKIIESGTYEELMEKKGFFADLVSRQLAS